MVKIGQQPQPGDSQCGEPRHPLGPESASKASLPSSNSLGFILDFLKIQNIKIQWQRKSLNVFIVTSADVSFGEGAPVCLQHSTDAKPAFPFPTVLHTHLSFLLLLPLSLSGLSPPPGSPW